MSKSNSKPVDAKQLSPKEKQKATLGMAGGFIAGVIGTVTAEEFQNNPNLYDIFKIGQNEPTVVPVVNAPAAPVAGTVPTGQLATGDFDKMSFGDAFEAARAKTGPGGVFSWHGQLFNTYTGNEWGALSDTQKTDFVEHTVHHYEPGDYTPSPESNDDAPQSHATHTAHKTDAHHAKHEAGGKTGNGGDTDIYDSLKLDDNAGNEVHVEAKPHGPNASNEVQVDVVESTNEASDAVIAENTTVKPEGDFAATPEVLVLQDIKNEDPNSKVHMQLAMVGDDAGIAGDIDGDGKTDMVIVDSNNDGKVEKSYYASMHDGNLDAVAYDNNQDGRPDAVDPLGAPPADNFDINNPDKDDFDPNADVSSWKE